MARTILQTDSDYLAGGIQCDHYDACYRMTLPLFPTLGSVVIAVTNSCRA